MRDTRYESPAWLVVAGVLLLLAASLPLLAVAMLVTRAAFVIGLTIAVIAGVIAYAASARFREWVATRPGAPFLYKGLRLAGNVYMHPRHVWARFDRRATTVGADDVVQAVLGPVEGVELPMPGCHVTGGDRLVRLRRGSRIVELPAPVSGTIVDTNDALRDHPELVNLEPFGEAWMVRIRGDRLDVDRQRLVGGEAARTWFMQDVDRLLTVLHRDETIVPTYADGGVLFPDLYRMIDDDAWSELHQRFFGLEVD